MWMKGTTNLMAYNSMAQMMLSQASKFKDMRVAKETAVTAQMAVNVIGKTMRGRAHPIRQRRVVTCRWPCTRTSSNWKSFLLENNGE